MVCLRVTPQKLTRETPTIVVDGWIGVDLAWDDVFAERLDWSKLRVDSAPSLQERSTKMDR